MVTSAGRDGAKMKMSPTIFISAGEASGEHYGALLAAALRSRLDLVQNEGKIFGMGGERMAAAGVECVVRSEEMAVMGLTEVVLHLPRIWREFRKLKQAIRQRPPSVAVLIDFPEIHLRLAEEFHRLGVPVVFFVSPQLWAWKKRRIRLVQKYIDRMLVIFPFEEPFYRQRGVQAEFVGHPLADLPLPTVSRAQFAAENGLDPGKTWIGLLPGSRPREIRDHLPTMLRSARILAAGSAKLASEQAAVLKGHGFSRAANGPKEDAALAAGGICDAETESLQFVVPLAPTLNAAQRNEVRKLADAHGGGLTLRLVEDARAALLHIRASVVASGTATVEAALIGNPFVVVYRVSPLTYAVAKRLVKVPHVAMANLIAGKQVVPELIQSRFTAENILRKIEPLLADGQSRQSMIEDLARIRGLLRREPEGRAGEAGSAIDRVAAITLEMIRSGFPGGG